MPLLKGQETETTAGTGIATIKKPTSDKLIITRIRVQTGVALTDFATGLAYLMNIQTNAHLLNFGSRIAQTPNYEGLIWEPNQEWYDGWQLQIRFRAQGAGVWRYFIEYEVVPEPKEPKWPGWK